MEKVYVFFANGTEEVEGLTVVDLLRRAEIQVTTVSIEEQPEIMGAHQIAIRTDAIFSDVILEDADMLVVPGGMPGTMNLLQHKGVQRGIQQFNNEGKMLAAICAAPIVLGAAGVLQGKKATCYPGHEDKLIGATLVEQSVVCDANVITSRGLGTAIDFSLAIISYFKGKEKAEQIAQAVIYKN